MDEVGRSLLSTLMQFYENVLDDRSGVTTVGKQLASKN